MVVASYVVLNNNDNVVMSSGYFISMYLLQSCCLISTNAMKDECKIARGGVLPYSISGGLKLLGICICQTILASMPYHIARRVQLNNKLADIMIGILSN